MKLLVTGGAGFIGSNFIFYVLKKHPEDSVVCLDALTYAGNLLTLSELEAEPRFTFVRGDIADRGLVFELVERERPDVVVNFAAETHVDRSLESPELFLRTNVLGVDCLLDACRKFGVHFHQVGTDEVYGDLPLDRPELLFTEDMPLKASSPYSASKAAADLLCLAYARSYGMKVTVSRCSNNYGPYQFPEKLIPLIILRAQAKLSLPVYGKGLNVRDWLYVEDHCSAIDLIIRRGRAGEVYNVGGRNERSNIETVRTLLGILGRPESLIQYVTDRPGHDLRYAIDPTKAERELGWKPAYSFAQGMEATVLWYQNNPDWLASTQTHDYRSYYERMYAGREKDAKPVRTEV